MSWMVRDVLYNTSITATAGIGTNPFLAKMAMDIVAKKARHDKDGVRIAVLDEMSCHRSSELISRSRITGKSVAE